MASSMRLLNRFLPFATPGTPLIQDIVHLAVLCVLLYFAPQIQQRVENWRAQTVRVEAEAHDGQLRDDAEHHDVVAEGHANAQDIEAIQDDNLVRGNQQADDRPGEDFQNVNDGVENGQPGPATLAPTRNVGAKKAKSLARKDQKRAYNEFMRSQGDAQRARDAEGAAEREAALANERERRALIEKDLQSRKMQEREAKRARDEQGRKEIARRTELVLDMVQAELDSRRMCNLFKVADALGDDVDEEWVERVLKASGMVGKTDESITMVTETGWVVTIIADDMNAVYQTAIEDDLGDDNGRITHEDLAALFGRVLEQHVDGVK